MSQFRVRQDGPGWAVYKNGRRYYDKTYATKENALSAAYRAASVGDSIQSKRLDGTWDVERTKGTFGPAGDY